MSIVRDLTWEDLQEIGITKLGEQTSRVGRGRSCSSALRRIFFLQATRRS